VFIVDEVPFYIVKAWKCLACGEKIQAGRISLNLIEKIRRVYREDEDI